MRPSPFLRASSRQRIAVAGLVAAQLGVALSSAAGARAAELPTDPAVRTEARQLGAEAVRRFRAGDYRGALALFERAYALVPAPTLGVRIARCLERLGRLVEAAERYREVSALTADPGAPAVHRQAIEEARVELAELRRRIPSLVVVVKGGAGHDVEVLVDGRRPNEARAGAALPVDPGSHLVSVRRGEVVVTQTAVLAEGETARVVVALAGADANGSGDADDGAWTVWATVALGFGVSGVVAGAINGLVAIDLEASLEERCPERTCPPDAHGQADVYDATRAATTIGFVVGGVGLAAAATLWLLEPSPAAATEDGVRITPWIGPAQAGVRGMF